MLELPGVPLRNTRFAEADLHGASTGREVAHRLAYPPRGHSVTAVPRPANLTEQGAPQDPRQDLTSGRVELGQKRFGTDNDSCGPGRLLKIPQRGWTLIHLAEQRDTSGAVERHLLGKLEEVKLQPGCGHRHVIRLPENTSELCVQRLITACPGAQQGRLLARHRRVESCTVQVPLVPLECRSRHQQPQP